MMIVIILVQDKGQNDWRNYITRKTTSSDTREIKMKGGVSILLNGSTRQGEAIAVIVWPRFNNNNSSHKLNIIFST